MYLLIRYIFPSSLAIRGGVLYTGSSMLYILYKHFKKVVRRYPTYIFHLAFFSSLCLCKYKKYKGTVTQREDSFVCIVVHHTQRVCYYIRYFVFHFISHNIILLCFTFHRLFPLLSNFRCIMLL